MAAIGTLPVVLGTGTHAARPAASAVGAGGLYSCTDHDLIYQTDGSSWTTWASLTGTGLSDPMTTRGDIIIRDATNTTARLAVGAAGRVFMSDGTDPSWTALGKAAYTRTSANYTTTSNTFVDVDSTNLALTITTGARRVLITFAGSIAHTTAADYCGLDVDVDGARLGGTFGIFWMNGQPINEPQNASFSYITDALSAGSHTFKLQWRRSTTGTITMYGTSQAFARFAVAELA